MRGGAEPTGVNQSDYEAKLHAIDERQQSAIAGWTPQGDSRRVLEGLTPQCAGAERQRSVQGCIHSVFWKAIPHGVRAAISMKKER